MILIFGLFQEIAQITGPRDSDIGDLIKDMVGALFFLGVYAVFDRRMKPYWINWGRKAKLVFLFLITILLLWSLIPLAVRAGVRVYGAAAFPRICGFESIWDNKILKTNHAELRRIPAPSRWDKAEGKKVGRVLFYPVNYPGFSIEGAFPDWTGYDYFTFKIYSELDSTFNLNIRIEDYEHNDEETDRFNDLIHLKNGMNNYTIPVEKIRTAPIGRDMDLAGISRILIFAYKPEAEFELYFDDFRLVKSPNIRHFDEADSLSNKRYGEELNGEI